MPLPKELQIMLSQNGGMVTTAQANRLGISNERLRLLTKNGDLERVSFGLYTLPNEFIDKMYISQQLRHKLIYSHVTALFLHDLTDCDPIDYSVTLPTGYNATGLRKEGFTVFTVKRELHQTGAVRMETMFGNSVTTYSMERTICDCIRSRNQMDIAIVTDAVKRYARRKDKNSNALMQMADMLCVAKPLRSYMEVLL